jgi:hypothetical protein
MKQFSDDPFSDYERQLGSYGTPFPSACIQEIHVMTRISKVRSQSFLTSSRRAVKRLSTVVPERPERPVDFYRILVLRFRTLVDNQRNCDSRRNNNYRERNRPVGYSVHFHFSPRQFYFSRFQSFHKSWKQFCLLGLFPSPRQTITNGRKNDHPSKYSKG